MKMRSTLRPAALAMVGVLSLGLAACADDTGASEEISEDINGPAEGEDLGGDDVQEEGFETEDLDSTDAPE